MVKKSHDPKLPSIRSSYKVINGQVDEVGWTSEDDVLHRLGRSQKDYSFRGYMRHMAAQGQLVGRQNPEHQYWEYGSQWREKDFATKVEAYAAAHMIKGTND